jgi:ribosome maturation protein SDO1
VFFALNSEQALDLIKAIQEADAIPLARTQMRIRLTIAAKEYKRLKDQLLPLLGTIEDEDADESYEITSLIEPGSLKAINDLLAKEVKTARGDDPPRLETLNVSVTDFQETAL